MKTWIKTTLLASTVLVALTACTIEKKVVPEEKQTITITGQMDGDELTEAGEQLISPYTFMLADGVFAEALKKNPENKKAQFYRAFLSSQMPLKGILTRMKPYLRAYGDIVEHEKTIRDLPESPLKTFLTSGKEDIRNLEDIQNVVSEIGQGYLNFRNFLKKNSNLNLTLNMNAGTFSKEIQKRAERSCLVYGGAPKVSSPDDLYEAQQEIEQIAEWNGESDFKVECNFREAAIMKINSADVVPLTQMAAGTYLYFSIYNSYSFKGLETLLQNKETSKEVAYETAMKSEALRLREDNGMKQLLVLGSDIVPAAKWAIQYQRELCPNGESTTTQRKGFLFEEGICIDDIGEINQSIVQLERALQGAIPVQIRNQEKDRMETTMIDYTVLAKNPIKDLRSLGLTGFNRCGELNAPKDKTLGGLFVYGDLDKYVSNECE